MGALLGVVAISISALAAEPKTHKYAILSLIGDSVSVVTHRQAVGSSLDRNAVQVQSMATPLFDMAALVAIDDVLRKRKADTVLVTPSASLHAAQERLVVDSTFQPSPELAETLRTAGATRLILLTKHRGKASLRLSKSTTGAGMVTGLGYYADWDLRTRRSDTGELAKGFLAPFVYIRASLIDTATSAILRQELITASQTMSAARSKEGVDPWSVLDPEQRVAHLRSMLVHELKRVTPILLGDAQ